MGLEVWKRIGTGEVRFLAMEEEHTVESEIRPDWCDDPAWEMLGETHIDLTVTY